MATLKTIFKYTLKILCALVLVVLTVLTTILVTYKPIVHDDSEMYRRGYIRHLLKAGESLGMRLCVLHNLWFYNSLMEDIRLAIEENRFEAFRRHVNETYLKHI